MASNVKAVCLKVFVDKKKNKVMFAEAERDFVEILFSFLTLPMGTIARLSSKHADSKDVKLGSLSSLYESVMNLDIKLFINNECKAALANPRNSSVALCQKLKVNLNDTNASVDGGHGDAVFVKSKASFIITDDLKVMSVLLDATVEVLSNLGVEYIDLLDERTLYFGLEEFSNLLKWSLLTNNPLTNLVLGRSAPCLCPSCVAQSTLSISSFLSSNSAQRREVKLLVQKSKNKVLCAQVENFFVELLFSFLTMPLGAVVRLTMDDSPPVGITNLYNSISSTEDGTYLKSKEVKAMLLYPKLASNYLRVTDFLPIYEASTFPGKFIKEQATFIISDDLEVAVSPSVSIISKFNTLGVPIGDIEVQKVSIGEPEALLILKASLISTSTLSSCLDAFRMARP